ncbi:DUF4998 domain-containing protein [Chitinophaga alhagiae]|uniref:DUF4998 domain-containing protein n=1 Tax=Chitinophaga alhagiae TaxID=2203219 RepID=UPI0013001EB1|nr:DUF4998 domain-containing protein [Chitinophaga alhagiae]
MKKYIWGMLGLGLLAACSKMEDNYQQYLENGVIIYTAKVDSLKAFPGRNRIALSWLLVSDPKIDKCRVFWNSGKDSVTIPVQRSAGIDTINVVLDNLEENVFTFDVYTYDNAGHSSVKEEIIGTVYGNNYLASLYNRPVRKTAYLSGTKEAEITWFGVNPQAVAVDIEYTNVDGDLVTKREVAVRPDPFKPLAFPDETVLPGYRQGTSFRYRTAYKPAPSAIDTFYTAYDIQQVP